MLYAKSMYKAGKIIRANYEDDYKAYEKKGLRCINCGEEVHLRRGKKNKPHFAHFHKLTDSPDCIYRSEAIKEEEHWFQLTYEGKKQRRKLFQQYFIKIIENSHSLFQFFLNSIFAQWIKKTNQKDIEILEHYYECFVKDKQNIIDNILSKTKNYSDFQLITTTEVIDYLCLPYNKGILKKIILFCVWLLGKDDYSINFDNCKNQLKHLLLSTGWYYHLSEIVNYKEANNIQTKTIFITQKDLEIGDIIYNLEGSSGTYQKNKDLYFEITQILFDTYEKVFFVSCTLLKKNNPHISSYEIQENFRKKLPASYLINLINKGSSRLIKKQDFNSKSDFAFFDIERFKTKLKYANQKERIAIFKEAISYSDEGIQLLQYTSFNDKYKLAKDTNTPLQVLQKLATDNNDRVRHEVASNPNTPVETLQQLAQNPKWRVRMRVASNPNTPIEVIKQLATDVKARVRTRVAINPNTSMEIIQQLAQDQKMGVRIRIAKNRNTPINILQELASDEREEVRWRIAKNSKTPVEILQILANDQDKEVRRGVAEHKKTPVEILQTLASDEDIQVRSRVAEHKKTPVEILKTLASDKEFLVRLRVAENPNTSAEIMKQLVTDQNWMVSMQAVANLNWSPEQFEELAQDQNRGVRCGIARNQNLPAKLLRQLARDKDKWIRWEVAKNPNLPVEILQELARDKDNGVRWMVATNINVPIELLQKLAQDPYSNVRSEVAQNLNTSVKILRELAWDKQWEVRINVAKNSNTQEDILKKLSQDPVLDVRQVADHALNNRGII